MILLGRNGMLNRFLLETGLIATPLLLLNNMIGVLIDMVHVLLPYFFFFNDTATTEIYTLSLHDALPIWRQRVPKKTTPVATAASRPSPPPDLKSTRLNSSHASTSYAVFCLKKKNTTVSTCRSLSYTSRMCSRYRRPTIP